MGHLEHYSHSASSAETRPPVWQQPAQGARGRGGAETGKAPSHSHACALGQSLTRVLVPRASSTRFGTFACDGFHVETWPAAPGQPATGCNVVPEFSCDTGRDEQREPLQGLNRD